MRRQLLGLAALVPLLPWGGLVAPLPAQSAWHHNLLSHLQQQPPPPGLAVAWGVWAEHHLVAPLPANVCPNEREIFFFEFPCRI